VVVVVDCVVTVGVVLGLVTLDVCVCDLCLGVVVSFSSCGGIVDILGIGMDLSPSWIVTLESGSPLTGSGGKISKDPLGKPSILAGVGSLFLISVKLVLSFLLGMSLLLMDVVSFLL
jgi:hypothetical protein